MARRPQQSKRRRAQVPPSTWLAAQRARQNAIATVTKRYARLGDNGAPERCHKSRQAETRRPKVIFDTQEQALACLQSLRDRGLTGMRRTYSCTALTGETHWHLTKQPVRESPARGSAGSADEFRPGSATGRG